MHLTVFLQLTVPTFQPILRVLAVGPTKELCQVLSHGHLSKEEVSVAAPLTGPYHARGFRIRKFPDVSSTKHGANKVAKPPWTPRPWNAWQRMPALGLRAEASLVQGGVS